MNPMDLKRGIDLAVEAVVADLQEELQEGHLERGDRPGRHHLRQRRRRDRSLPRRGDEEGRQRRRHHGRGGQEPGDRARRGRGHAVRPRLHLALLHHQRRQDADGDGGSLHSHLRKEAVRPAGAAAVARGGGADLQAARHRRRGRRGRGTRHARGQQAARWPEGRGGEGPGLRRSPQGHAAGHRHPDRRPGDQRGPRHQARERHARPCSGAPRR